MQLKHASTTASASFDDPNLVSSAGLVPIMALAEKAGLRQLAQKWLSVPTDKGANAGLKVASLVGGMVAGAATAPIIVAHRLRRGACGSPRGAKRLISDSHAIVKRLPGMEGARILFRADSAYYGHAAIQAAITAGAHVSVTVRMNPAIRKAITSIPDHAWETIQYTNAIFDKDTNRWISTAEVAEVSFTAFTSRKKSEQITGRLVVRRIPELNKKNTNQPTLFDTHRFHGFFTTSDLDTVTADKTHRAHAVIELVNSNLKNSALAHLTSVHRQHRLGHPVRPRLRTTRHCDHLTDQPTPAQPRTTQWNARAARPSLQPRPRAKDRNQRLDSRQRGRVTLGARRCGAQARGAAGGVGLSTPGECKHQQCSGCHGNGHSCGPLCHHH